MAANQIELQCLYVRWWNPNVAQFPKPSIDAINHMASKQNLFYDFPGGLNASTRSISKKYLRLARRDRSDLFNREWLARNL
jgi:hypothetical protein